MERKILLIVVVIIGLITGMDARAQSVGDYGAVKNGIWSDASVWKLWNGSAFSTPATVPPRGTDGVYTNSFTIQVATDAACDNLTLTDVANAISIDPGVTLTINGAMDAAKKLKKDAIGGTGTIKFTGTGLGSVFTSVIGKNITDKVSFHHLTFDPGSGAELLASDESIEVAGNLLIASGVVEFGPKADINGINAAHLLVAEDAKGIVYGSIASGKSAKSQFPAITIDGVLEVYNYVNSTSFILDSSGVFNTAFKGQKGWWKNKKSGPETVFLGGTVIYSGTSQGVAGFIYNNLFLAGKGQKRLAGDVLVNGILSMQGTTVLSPGRMDEDEDGDDDDGDEKKFDLDFGPKGTLEYAGSIMQTTGPEFPGTEGPLNLWIRNANGVVLDDARTIQGELLLVTGNLHTTMEDLITVGPAGTVTGGKSSSFVSGPLGRAVNSTALVTMAYPVGKEGDYQPLDLQLSQATTDLTVYIAEAFLGAPPVRPLPATLDRVSPHNYWHVSSQDPVGRSSAAELTTGQITLYYTNGEGVTDPANLRVAGNVGTPSWVDLGGTGTGAPDGSITSTVNFTELGDFVLANAKGGGNFGALPVTLVAFDAALNNNAVLLSWTTASELNNAGFEIERSNDGMSWEKIGFVTGKINSTTLNNYTFADVNISSLTTSVAYYRLKQVDLNGTYEYSPVESVKLKMVKYTALGIDKVYPNPSKDELNININIPESSLVKLEISDYTGKVVYSETLQLSDGSSLLKYNAIGWSNGVYVIKAQSNNEQVTMKWVKY